MKPFDQSLHQTLFTSNSTQDEIQFYEQRVNILNHLMWYQGVINNPILILLSVCILYKILFVSKRCEIFLVLIPILFCINSLWWFYDSLGQLLWNLDFE